MKKLIVISFVFLMSCGSSQKLYFSDHVEKVLFGMSENYEIETILCLKYQETWFGNIYVYDYYIPDVARATRMSVTTRSGCPEGYDGMWHNHPEINFMDIRVHKYLSRYFKLEHEWQLVYLSGADIRMVLGNGYGLTIVSTGRNIAWWNRGQVAEAEGAKILFPIESQFVKQ